MSARLTTAIKIGDAARGVYRKTKSIPDSLVSGCFDPEEHEHPGVEPMLLALSMELALKAWFVFDFDDPNVPKTHNLVKLYDQLRPESQTKLDIEFQRTVLPYHPDFGPLRYSIRDLLFQHKDAFTDWRYMHEARKSMSFNTGTFEATLEMVLNEFRKRYRVEKYQPVFGSGSIT